METGFRQWSWTDGEPCLEGHDKEGAAKVSKLVHQLLDAIVRCFQQEMPTFRWTGKRRTLYVT